MTLSIAAEEGYFYGGNVSASADPYIQIDPTFARVNDYVISVSPGVGNVALISPVPEHSTWLMLFAGFGAIGTRQRNNQKQRRQGYSTTL